MRRSVAVIGGGITGLAAAHALCTKRPDLNVTLMEQSDRLGGKIQTESVDGYTIEGGPDSFLSVKPRGVGLSRELGLENRFIRPIEENAGSFVFSRGQLVPLPEGLSGLVPSRLGPMFRTPLLSPAAKVRVAMELGLRSKSGNDDETVAAFIERRFGKEVYARMIEPLMAGIYAGDGRKLSLAATFPRLRATERTHGGIILGALATKRELARRQEAPIQKRGFLSFQGGMIELVNCLQVSLRGAGAEIETGADVRSIAHSPDGSGFDLEVVREGHVRERTFDAVIVATPAWRAAELARQVAPAAARTLGGIPHVSNALVSVAFDASRLSRPLRGYGYVVPRVENRAVMAMTWVSSKWRDRAPDGKVLVRAFIGRAGQEQYLSGDDASLIQIARREIEDVLGVTGNPDLTRVYRWERGMPQYNLGHLQRVHSITAECNGIPGFEIAGNMFRGVGIPDCIASAEGAATSLLATITEWDTQGQSRPRSYVGGGAVTS
ncbi:MAG: protoporphyrinogen oxidase [Chloroflexota bacterium]|nr:protoporphyrinogen oxidase [Chloroflexota bacterium]